MQSEDKLFVDDQWRPQDIPYFKKFNIKLPILNELYTFRQIEKTNMGIGVYLNEIHNPETPVEHFMGVSGVKEVSFSIKRFRNLDGSEITEEEIKDIKEELGNGKMKKARELADLHFNEEKIEKLLNPYKNN